MQDVFGKPFYVSSWKLTCEALHPHVDIVRALNELRRTRGYDDCGVPPVRRFKDLEGENERCGGKDGVKYSGHEGGSVSDQETTQALDRGGTPVSFADHL
jgi:hypothetical protein